MHTSPANGRPATQNRLSRLYRGPLYVTYDALDGLANRLRLHFLAYAYALQPRRRLVTQWVRNQNCYAGYHDLFDGGPVEYDALNVVERFWLRRLRFHPRFHDCQVFTAGTLPDCRGVEFLPDRLHRIVHLAGDLEASVECGSRLGPFHRTALKSLVPKAIIRKDVDSFLANLSRPYVGVHVRRGDFVPDGGSALPPFPGAWRVPLERFSHILRRIRNCLPEASILLVTDGSDLEVQPLLNEFGGRLRAGQRERNSLAGTQGALIDLLVLADSDLVIGTPYSSISSMGAFIGDKPYIPAWPTGWESQLDRALGNIARDQTTAANHFHA